MQEHKHTKPSIEFPDMFPALLVLFFLVTIVGVLLLSYQQMLAKTACIQAAAEAEYTAEQTERVCNIIRL